MKLLKAEKEAPCPRWGFIKLSSKNRDFVKRTVCKTWTCKICMHKRAAMVRMRIQYGFSAPGESYLITLTLRADVGQTHTVDFVGRAWARLLRKLKDRSPSLSWFKVIEATKKGTPHLHLIVMGIGDRKDNCRHFKEKLGRKYMDRECTEDCLVHEWGKAWYVETDAYIVDARKIYSKEGVGIYLAKYLVKGFEDRARLLALGFKRRWSCSRNWTSPNPLRLRGPDGGWTKTEIIPRYFRRKEMELTEKLSEGHQYMDSVGDDLAIALGDLNNHRKGIKKIGRMLDNVSKAV